MYMMGIILSPAYKRWPRLANTSKWAEPVCHHVHLPIAASFANPVEYVILTQVILYGIGGSLIYYPALNSLDEWFVRRKGMAMELCGREQAAGLIIPFVMNSSLENTASRPRVASGRSTHHHLIATDLLPASSSSHLSSFPACPPRAWVHALVAILAAFDGTGLVSTIGIGMMIDRFHVTAVILLNSVGAACILRVLCWGVVSTMAGVVKLERQGDENTDVGSLLGVLSVGRGIGAVVSGLSSEALLSGSPWKGEAGLGYGSGYGSLIVFTGVTATLGSVGFMGRRLGWM
ncbi:hypothetical protein LARI1_G007910 [Lachnellula arida]|uniref:Uncharacterized protein n=1 Tax=Lachnellula arida TaxID=1316785 RepID=A0A8T9B0W6_9HELO|nr:hypothetical protein LARI1_G007910 [Lachnellula arida]